MTKTVVAAALGECVHVAGVHNFLRLAESAGWRIVFLGPAVSIEDVLQAASKDQIAGARELISRLALILPTGRARIWRAVQRPLTEADLWVPGVLVQAEQALEQRLQGHVDRPVHHEAERPLVVVLADVGQRPREVRIGHVGHGDQEMMSEVHDSYCSRARDLEQTRVVTVSYSDGVSSGQGSPCTG